MKPIAIPEDIYNFVMGKFAQAGGCVRRITIDIGGREVIFSRDRSTIGILG